MAGYSGTPLAQKLGIKAGQRVALLGAPTDFVRSLEPLPADVRWHRTAGRGRSFDVIIVFVDRRADLARRFGRLAERLTPAGGLWVAWPKKASRVTTDLTENEVRAVGLAEGLVDNKVCAVDEIWS